MADSRPALTTPGLADSSYANLPDANWGNLNHLGPMCFGPGIGSRCDASTPGGILGLLAGVGDSLANLPEAGKCALNDAGCAQRIVTGGTPSDMYTRWVCPPPPAARTVKALRKKSAAKDILRAAGLPLLGPGDSKVGADYTR